MHHILYQKRAWNASYFGREMRSQWGLIVPIDEEVHSELHRDLWEGVPVLGTTALRQVMSTFERRDTYLGTIDSVMLAISRTRDFETDLTLAAIEAQIPYLEEGMTRTHINRKLHQSHSKGREKFKRKNPMSLPKVA